MQNLMTWASKVNIPSKLNDFWKISTAPRMYMEACVDDSQEIWTATGRQFSFLRCIPHIPLNLTNAINVRRLWCPGKRERQLHHRSQVPCSLRQCNRVHLPVPYLWNNMWYKVTADMLLEMGWRGNPVPIYFSPFVAMALKDRDVTPVDVTHIRTMTLVK